MTEIYCVIYKCATLDEIAETAHYRSVDHRQVLKVTDFCQDFNILVHQF